MDPMDRDFQTRKIEPGFRLTPLAKLIPSQFSFTELGPTICFKKQINLKTGLGSMLDWETILLNLNIAFVLTCHALSSIPYYGSSRFTCRSGSSFHCHCGSSFFFELLPCQNLAWPIDSLQWINISLKLNDWQFRQPFIFSTVCVSVRLTAWPNERAKSKGTPKVEDLDPDLSRPVFLSNLNLVVVVVVVVVIFAVRWCEKRRQNPWSEKRKKR